MGMVVGFQVEDMSAQLQELQRVDSLLEEFEVRPIGPASFQQLLIDDRKGHSTWEWRLDQLDLDAPLFPFYPTQAEILSQFSTNETTTPLSLESMSPLAL